MKNNMIYNKSIFYIVTLCLLCLFGYVFFLNGINGVTKVKVYYQRGSLVNYNVNYDLEELVDSIDINYVYKTAFSENVNVNYTYSVTAYLHAYQKNIKDIIWFRRYDLVKDEVYEVLDSNYAEINNNIKLDYKKYNEDLNNFLNSSMIEGKGYLNLQVNFVEHLNDKEVSKTVNIDIMMDDYKANINVNNVLEKDSYYNFDRHSMINFIAITISMLCFSLAVSFIFLIARQFKIIGARQSRYSKEIKKILSKYDYAIVKVNKLYVNKRYNMIYVDNFMDLLDVYNSKDVMISYKETKRGMESIFVIIDSNDAWIYKFTSDDIK